MVRRMVLLVMAGIWAVAFDAGPALSEGSDEAVAVMGFTSISCYGASADGTPPKGAAHHRDVMERWVEGTGTSIDDWELLSETASSAIYQLDPVPGHPGVVERVGFVNFGGGWLHETHDRVPEHFPHH